MTSTETSGSLRELAQAADEAAERGRPWQIGHVLATDLTTNGRSMTPDEVALVQALERMLDWAGGDDRPFRAWWLDEDTPLDEVRDTWPAVWESVASTATHPTVVAHLSDLLWSARYGQRHLHARRAVDAYLASAELLEEPHDRCRSLIRAHQLAGAVRDSDRLARTEVLICDAAAAALAAGDHPVLVSLLEHLVSGRRGDEMATRSTDLLDRAWRSVSRTDHVERLGKILLRHAPDDNQRRAITGRVVAAFRNRAGQEEGFGRLVALREALRVAEELGHPSYRDILHEIEMLDSESAFTAVHTELVISRQDVAAFCAEVVGTDSLQNALARFAAQLPITPESVQHVRDVTQVGIQHLVTSYRIGEANSVVTTSDTTEPGEDTIAAAVERDVLQRVGHGALIRAFLFLGPALHQTLVSYEPWDLTDLHEIVEGGPADPVVADALARALQHFHHRRYDEAVHVALPRVERLIRHIARRCGVATTKRPMKRVGGIRGLGEILAELRGGEGSPILPEPILTAAELTLVDPDSLNLRNEFLHGISNEARAAEAALVLQLGLTLSLHISLRTTDAATE